MQSMSLGLFCGRCFEVRGVWPDVMGHLVPVEL